MASVLLATAAITLSAIIAALISTISSDSFEVTSLLLGDKRKGTTSIKFLCVLICFLMAFMCNIQSVRYYSHVSFLISIPLGPDAPGLDPNYVNSAMSRGAQFWSLGLRAFYLSFPMFLWLFGPIPMFLCSLILTVLLHFRKLLRFQFPWHRDQLQENFAWFARIPWREWVVTHPQLKLVEAKRTIFLLCVLKSLLWTSRSRLDMCAMSKSLLPWLIDLFLRHSFDATLRKIIQKDYGVWSNPLISDLDQMFPKFIKAMICLKIEYLVDYGLLFNT